MSRKSLLASPLMGTAMVLAGLGLLAIPLCRLTSGSAGDLVRRENAQVQPKADQEVSPAIFRLRLLAAAKKATISTSDGKVLWEKSDLPAGETEEDVEIPFVGKSLSLKLFVESSAADPQTAAFLTVMPDGLEGKTRYAIGEGEIRETLKFKWVELPAPGSSDKSKSP